MSVRDTLGDRVRDLREAAKLSQAELAKAAQLSRIYVGSVERAEQAATVDVLEKLAAALRVAPARLIDDTAAPVRARLTREEAFAAKIANLTRGASAADLEKFERVARAYFGQPRSGAR